MTKINFSGSIDDVKRKIEETIATYELLGDRAQIEFEEWYESWENGWPEAIENRALGNYPLTGENQWRAKAENRPRWRQFFNKKGVLKGEYWRDRSNDGDSVPLSGTPEQLIDQIIKIEHQGKSESQKISSDIIRYSGIPEIKLFFRGRDLSLPRKDQVITGQKSFRFVGYTDNPEVAAEHQNIELITQNDIDRISAKIQSVFRTTPPYTWPKGKEQVIYHDWSRGYNLNVYCSSHSEGERLITAILAVRDFQINEKFLKYGKAKNPALAYPPPQEIQVLGEKYKTAERLPTADAAFQYAEIYLPTIKKTKIIA